MHTQAIEKAITEAGGQTALARAINVSQGLVWQWCNGAPIPTKHFAAIERATGVTAHALLADEMAKAEANASPKSPAEKVA